MLKSGNKSASNGISVVRLRHFRFITFINKHRFMNPTKTRAPRRSRKQELVEYLPKSSSPRAVQSPEVQRLVGLAPGVRILVEVEALAVSDKECVAGNLCIVDGPNHQSFPDIHLRIHDVRYK